MNKAFLDNPSKQKLLLVFFEQPARFFSVKELILRAELNERRVKTLLNFFSKHNLLTIAEKKRLKYYQINRRSGNFAELRKVFEDTKPTATRDPIARSVLSCGSVKLAVLSGVFVGDVQAEADLLVVGNIVQSRLDRAVKYLQSLMGLEINFAVMTEKEYLDRYYGFDWFLKEIMDRTPVVLVDEISDRESRKKIRGDMVQLMS